MPRLIFEDSRPHPLRQCTNTYTKVRAKPRNLITSGICFNISNFQIFKGSGCIVSATKRERDCYLRTHGATPRVKQHFCKVYSLTHPRECENTLNYATKARWIHHRTTNSRVQEHKVRNINEWLQKINHTIGFTL